MIPSVLAPVYTPTRATTTMQRNITNDIQLASEEVEVASVGIKTEIYIDKHFDNSRARAYCACSRFGWGGLDIFTLIYPPLSPSL